MIKLKLQYFSHLMQITDSFEKTLMLGKIEGGRRRGQQDEMFGWHHQLDGHEREQVPGVGDGQGSLACSSPWGHKELDLATEQLPQALSGVRLNETTPCPRAPRSVEKAAVRNAVRK